jgi:hypothetical protein
VAPAAIVAVRSHLLSGLEGAKGGHAIQEAGNIEAVPDHALQRVRAIFQRGLDSISGGHSVQRATHQPMVSGRALSGAMQTIAEDPMGLAGGSAIQPAVESTDAMDTAAQALQLLAEISAGLSTAREDLPKMQAAGLQSRAARQLLG